MAGLDIRRDGGLFLVQGMVIIQQSGGSNDTVGKIPLVQSQLLQRAHHAVGEDAPQLALFDLLAAGKGGFVERYRHQIPGVDIPGAGDDLDGLCLPDIQLADPHMIGVGMALHGGDAAHHHIGDLSAQILGDFHLGSGEGHGLGKVFIIGINGDKLAEPLSA